jgi:hypothetical protein
MYNMLMTAGSGNWRRPTWTLPSGRFLEHTNNSIILKYSSLSDSVVHELKNIPTLFAYEKYLSEPALVGCITEIQRGHSEIKITLALDASVPPISPEILSSLYYDLDIDPKFEVHRTHWSVKDVDLVSVLKKAGIVKATDLLPQGRPPKVFISYSWDFPEHREWIAYLGGSLRSNGIDAILDQWHVRGGEDLAAFMERSLRESDRVLVICTENYVTKANNRTGGVGYEHMMVTGELIQNIGSSKFIPVVRQSNDKPILPTELATRFYFDLSDGPNHSEQMQLLVKDLHNIKTPVPPLGRNPFV